MELKFWKPYVALPNSANTASKQPIVPVFAATSVVLLFVVPERICMTKLPYRPGFKNHQGLRTTHSISQILKTRRNGGGESIFFGGNLLYNREKNTTHTTHTSFFLPSSSPHIFFRFTKPIWTWSLPGSSTPAIHLRDAQCLCVLSILVWRICRQGWDDDDDINDDE